ncbi:MAG: hypothetical protein ACIAQU_07030 [Phycisphaerales bacterium JB064]
MTPLTPLLESLGSFALLFVWFWSAVLFSRFSSLPGRLLRYSLHAVVLFIAVLMGASLTMWWQTLPRVGSTDVQRMIGPVALVVAVGIGVWMEVSSLIDRHKGADYEP